MDERAFDASINNKSTNKMSTNVRQFGPQALCRNWEMNGTCGYGRRCHFAHPKHYGQPKRVGGQKKRVIEKAEDVSNAGSNSEPKKELAVEQKVLQKTSENHRSSIPQMTTLTMDDQNTPKQLSAKQQDEQYLLRRYTRATHVTLSDGAQTFTFDISATDPDWVCYLLFAFNSISNRHFL